MDDLSEIRIPLLLHMVDPIAIFVINNQNLGCELFQDVEQHPVKAYNLINDLYFDHFLIEKLPKRLYEHFELYPEKEGLIPYSGECFGGERDEYSRAECIDFEVKIVHEKEPYVLLYDFKYGRDACNILKLKYQVKLSIPEAFYIFSNICSNITYNWYWKFNPKTFIENIHNREFTMDQIFKKAKDFYFDYFSINRYSYEYLLYLYENLLSEKLSPLELLRLNGAPTLSKFKDIPIVKEFIKEVIYKLKDFYNIPYSKKLLYFFFLEHLTSLQQAADPFYRDFFALTLKRLEKEILKEFVSVEGINLKKFLER